MKQVDQSGAARGSVAPILVTCTNQSPPQAHAFSEEAWNERLALKPRGDINGGWIRVDEVFPSGVKPPKIRARLERTARRCDTLGG